MADAERWALSPKEVQERLGLSRTTTYQLIQSGVLPSMRLGRSIRVPASALREFLDKQTSDGALHGR